VVVRREGKRSQQKREIEWKREEKGPHRTEVVHGTAHAVHRKNDESQGGHRGTSWASRVQLEERRGGRMNGNAYRQVILRTSLLTHTFLFSFLPFPSPSFDLFSSSLSSMPSVNFKCRCRCGCASLRGKQSVPWSERTPADSHACVRTRSQNGVGGARREKKTRVCLHVSACGHSSLQFNWIPSRSFNAGISIDFDSMNWPIGFAQNRSAYCEAYMHEELIHSNKDS